MNRPISHHERQAGRAGRLSRRRARHGVIPLLSPNHVSRLVALQCHAISLRTMADMRANAGAYRPGTAGREQACREFMRAREAARRERRMWRRRGGFLP